MSSNNNNNNNNRGGGEGEGGYGDDFLEQILSHHPSSYSPLPQSHNATSTFPHHVFHTPSFLRLDDAATDSNPLPFPVKTERESGNMENLFPVFDPSQPHSIRHNVPQFQQGFCGQPTHSTAVSVPQPPGNRPRVRARRGQATDPHSIAERLRRERIAERMRALQELVPSCNKTDRAAMLDEILEYVKFLRLQVKVLSMSRLGGVGAVAQLVADIPLSSVEGDSSEGEINQQAWDKWSNIDTEQEVAKLMNEDVGAAMQYLQAKGLCIMPTSLAALMYPNQPHDASSLHNAEPHCST